MTSKNRLLFFEASPPKLARLSQDSVGDAIKAKTLKINAKIITDISTIPMI